MYIHFNQKLQITSQWSATNGMRNITVNNKNM